MDIKYKIVAFYPESGSIAVNWFCDELPEGITYCIDLPVENGKYCSMEQIESIIKFQTPKLQIERILNLRTIPIPEELKCYILEPPKPEIEIDLNKPVVIFGTAEIPKQ
jgi:hypothetical protein